MNQEKYNENICKLSNSYSTMYNHLLCIEELSELQKAITKISRLMEFHDSDSKSVTWHLECDKAVSDIVEEMADVNICIDMLKVFFGIDDDTLQKKMCEKWNVICVDWKGRRGI